MPDEPDHIADDVAMGPDEAGLQIARLIAAGYLYPTRREVAGQVLEMEDEFIVGPATGDVRVAVLAAIRRHSDGSS